MDGEGADCPAKRLGEPDPPSICYLSIQERGPLWRGGPNPVELHAPGETMKLLEGIPAFYTPQLGEVGVSVTLPFC